jgi:NTE family protein
MPEDEMDGVSSPRRALVLSGGGARGAYEVGVLDYLLQELPRRIGGPVRFDLITGSSVGAIHACFLAATAQEGPERMERLAAIWTGMKFGEIFHLSTREALRIPRRLFGLMRGTGPLQTGRLPPRLHGLLDTTPLERIVLSQIPWRRVRRNVREGRLTAVSVAATQIATGRVVVFTEHATPERMPWTRDPSILGRAVHIGPHHALASAAIPMLFPAVRVENTYYADGGIRLNTPLAPALRLGASHVLVIGLSHGTTLGEEAELAAGRVESYGNPVFMFGKMLNALLLDHVDADLAHMRVINDILASGGEAFGASFLEKVNAVVKRRRGQHFRVVEDLVIRPSRDLGREAAEVLASQREDGRMSAVLRLMLGAAGVGEHPTEADLVSYLLFDADYTQRLIELGRSDARGHEEALAAFFAD